MQILLSRAIDVFFQVLEWLIFIRIILSWIALFGINNRVGRCMYELTEPILGPCRRMLDKSPLGGGMMLDFSPVIALILMVLVKQLLLGLVAWF